MSADGLLRSGYERWLRLEAEKKAISDDLKELFGELKSHGFDGKALRVAFREVATIDDTAKQELGAVVDLYVATLIGTEIAMRGTREAQAEAEGADPATGELPDDEHEPQPLAAQTVPAQPVAKSPAEGDAVETSAPIPDAADALPVAATELPRPVVASHTPETAKSGEAEEAADGESPSTQGSADAAPNRGGDHEVTGHEQIDKAPGCRPVQGGQGADSVVLGSDVEPVALIQPETATSSTAQRPTEAAHVASVAGREIGEVGGGTRAFPAVDTHPVEAGAPAGEAVATAVASPVSNVTDIRKKWRFEDKAHADCLDPAQCGGFSNLGLCQRCKAALGAADVDEAATG